MASSVNLFCLPFAGGSKYSFREMEEHIPSFINVIPLEYPGRGSRIREPIIRDIHVLVENIYQQIGKELDKAPYAIYGHSMGGLVACLLARRIISQGHPLPLHLFITGSMGPSGREKEGKKRHLMDKPSFIGELKRLNGMPEEILNDTELLDYFEPIIRADFETTETYQYEEAPPLDIPLTVITGTEEDIEPENISLWQKETRHAVDFRRMAGTHFFIYQYPAALAEIIAKKLFNSLKPIHCE
jgi:surfactin synthase thioesterase subunit